jgi:hypothetical protein
VIPLSGRVPKELMDPPDLASMMVAAYSMFHGKLSGSLGFPRRGEYIGGRAASGGGPGGPTTWWRGLGAGPWSPSISALDSISCREK